MSRPAAADLFARRRREQRRGRIARVLVVVLAVAFAGTVVWLVCFSSVLAVTRIDVQGLTTMKKRDVISAAHVALGRPLARVDTGAVKARLITLKRVESVEVSRTWPHTLSVVVIERTPVAYLDTVPIEAIDRYGIAYRTFRKPPPGVVQARVVQVDPRKRQQALETVGRIVLDLKREFPELGTSIQYVSAESRDSVQLHLTGNRLVIWGSEARPAAKAKVLRALLGGVTARRYDVSAPDQPTTAGS